MKAESRPRVGAAGYSGQVPTKPPEWHGLVVWDVLLNNLSTGLYLTAAVAEWAAPAALEPVARVAYPAALVLILIDLVLLVLDLGDPWRFHHMLRVFKLSSPMSLGVWALSAYSFFLTAVVALSLLPGEGLDGVRRLVALVGLPFALASSAYKGVLFSTTAQPAWRDGRWLGAYLTTASLMLGAGQLLFIALATGSEQGAALLRPALALLIVLNAVSLGLLIAEFWPTLARVPGRARYHILGVVATIGATVLPLALLAASGERVVLALAIGLLLLGALVWRYLLVWLPHSAS